MNNRMKIEFPAKSENERLARTVCAAFVLELDPTVEEISELKTAVSEAVTNSIIHGYSDENGMIEIEAELCGNTAKFILRDFGCGIDDIKLAMQPLYSGSGDKERSGMGFSIMEAFMDKLEVESGPSKGTTITMTKRFSVNEQ